MSNYREFMNRNNILNSSTSKHFFGVKLRPYFGIIPENTIFQHCFKSLFLRLFAARSAASEAFSSRKPQNICGFPMGFSAAFTALLSVTNRLFPEFPMGFAVNLETRTKG